VPGYAKGGEPGIPEPQFYGGTGREIYFATGLEPYLRRPFAPGELKALLALFAEAQLTPAQLEEEYEDVLVKGGLRGGHYREPAPKLADAGLDGVIGFLARAGKMSGVDVAVPVPLLELVARLAHLAGNAAVLHQWCLDIADKLRDKEFTHANIAALGYTRATPWQAVQARYLLIAFEPVDRNARMVCTAEAWLVDAEGNGEKVAKRPEVIPDRFAAFIDEALGHSRVQDHLRSASERLPIELIVPVALLDAEPDDWTPEGYGAPLSSQYAMVVRPIERSPGVSAARYTAGWGAGWHGCEPCRAARGQLRVLARRAAAAGFSRAARGSRRVPVPASLPTRGGGPPRPPRGRCRHGPVGAQILAGSGLREAAIAPRGASAFHPARCRAQDPLSVVERRANRTRRGARRRRSAAVGRPRVPKRTGKEDEAGRVRRLRNPMRPT
jgi:hypothetical protein